MRDEQVAAFAEAGQETAQYEPESENAPAPPSEAGGDSEVLVRVTGEPGIRFQGSISTPDRSRSVEGVTPQDFPVEVDEDFLAFDSVSANAQNSDGRGNLTVQIVQDGEVVEEASTTAQYGLAQVNWSPAE